jgi:hypothetical protein
MNELGSTYEPKMSQSDESLNPPLCYCPIYLLVPVFYELTKLVAVYELVY